MWFETTAPTLVEHLACLHGHGIRVCVSPRPSSPPLPTPTQGGTSFHLDRLWFCCLNVMRIRLAFPTLTACWTSLATKSSMRITERRLKFRV